MKSPQDIKESVYIVEKLMAKDASEERLRINRNMKILEIKRDD